MATAGTTISCRAFALTAALLVLAAAASAAGDTPGVPRLPVAIRWTVDLSTGVATAPVSDGNRIFLALRSAHLTARDVRDGRELWRIEKDVSSPFAADAGLLFIAAGEAIEARRTSDGASAWVVPRLIPAAPLVAAGGFLFVVSSTEIVAIRAADGGIVWRQAAGGVRHAPAIDGDRLYVGADDGRVLALETATGVVRWEQYVRGGVTALAASRGLVYAGAGDKQLHCLDGRNGGVRWSFRVGSFVGGHIAVDEDRVYFAALDNVIRALDRTTGNQRWKEPVSRRPIAGVRAIGHVVFVPLTGAELVMLFDRDGARSGVLTMPGDITSGASPEVRETEAGLELFVVTGGLSNQWQLTHVGPAGELALVPFSSLAVLPGAVFLTDPLTAPLAVVLPWVFGDPVLHPFTAIGWPIRLDDPPLVPLTTLPGLQLRPLSPVLPPRRGA